MFFRERCERKRERKKRVSKCVSACVCVWERERVREIEIERERERERERKRKKEESEETTGVDNLTLESFKEWEKEGNWLHLTISGLERNRRTLFRLLSKCRGDCHLHFRKRPAKYNYFVPSVESWCGSPKLFPSCDIWPSLSFKTSKHCFDLLCTETCWPHCKPMLTL